MARESTLKNWDDFWDKDKSVEDIYPTSDAVVQNLVKVTDVKGLKILEVGGGTGRDSTKLSQLGAEVTVIDYSENALIKVREAIRLSGSDVTLIRGDGTNMPFDDGTFDVVFHQGLMEHFRDPMPLFTENVRVLKEGGLLLIDVPQKYHVYTIVKHILILLNKWFAGWETEFTISQLRGMYKENSLDICREYGDYMVPSFTYRSFREVLKAFKVKLPMYPAQVPVFNSIRKSVKEFINNRPFFLNTYLNIGIIGKKT